MQQWWACVQNNAWHEKENISLIALTHRQHSVWLQQQNSEDTCDKSRCSLWSVKILQSAYCVCLQPMDRRGEGGGILDHLQAMDQCSVSER